MKKNVRNVMTLIVPIILVVIFVLVLLVYILGRSAQEEDLRKDALLSAVAEQKMRYTLMLENGFAELDVLSSMMGSSKDQTSQELLKQVHQLIDSTKFQEILLINSEGEIWIQAGSLILTEPTTFVRHALVGERTISALNSLDGDETRTGLAFAVPIWQDGAVVGAAAGVLSVSALNERFNLDGLDLFETVMFDLKGNTVYTEDGCSLGKTGDSLYQWLGSATADQRSMANQLRTDLRLGLAGAGAFRSDGERWYLAYAPLDRNDWSIGLLLSAQNAEAALHVQSARSYELVAVIMLSALLLSLFVVLFFRTETTKSIREQIGRAHV